MHATQVSRKALTFAALLAAWSGWASAVPLLNDGNLVPLPGTSVLAQPQLAGVVLAERSNRFSFAAYGGMVTGTIVSRVVRSDLDGSLDFYWQVLNDAGSSGPVQDLRLGDFIAPDFKYDANWRLDGLGDEGPGQGSLFAGPLGVSVQFHFWGVSQDEAGAGLNPGQLSKWMFLDTTATHFATNARLDVTARYYVNSSDSFAAFGPSAVPEPGTWLLMGLGLAAVAGRARRQRGAPASA